MKKIIYLDSAATTQLDERVLDVMLPAFQELYGNPSSVHAKGREARAAIERARKTVARRLNASPGEIFFTSGGTESNNTVIKNCVRDLGVTCIISSELEHHCVLDSVKNMADQGTTVEYLNVDELGYFDHEHLKQLLEKHSDEKVLVTLIHANNEIGTVNDIEAIGNICKEYGAYFHSDTVQTIAHYPFDLEKLNIHFLSGAGHKFHGPKGCGMLYINSDVHIDQFIHGGGQERNMRSGTENVAGILGFTKAFDLAYEELDATYEYISGLKQYFKSQLQKIEGVKFNGCQQNGLFTVLNVQFPVKKSSAMLLFNLDIAGVCASAGSACSSGANAGSHVLEGIGADTTKPTIRFSFSKYNTREELDEVVQILEGIISKKPRQLEA